MVQKKIKSKDKDSKLHLSKKKLFGRKKYSFVYGAPAAPAG